MSIYNFDKVLIFEYVLGMKTIIQLTPEKLI